MAHLPTPDTELVPIRHPLPPLLHLVVLGGRMEGVHIEMHDVRFVVGATLEDTFPELRRQWVGRRRGLHIDSVLVVRQVGGYAVELCPGPFNGGQRLWFVNVGGYRPERLAEDHAFGLVVATTAAGAKRQALARWLPEAVERHKDDLRLLERVGTGEGLDAVDDCLPLEMVGGWWVHLIPSTAPDPPLRPDWFGYRPI